MPVKKQTMTKLFLIKADFTDPQADSEGKRYFCPYCATVEGVLSYYPELKEKLDIQYVDFKRPRPAIIDLIGEENQSCPVLIIDEGNEPVSENIKLKAANGKLFINETDDLFKYLSEAFGIGFPHS
jgi:glutaredoxin